MQLNVSQKRLIRAAIQVRKRAYAPYSGFKVGAAVETADGKIYTGCNVESAAYSATSCAERVAMANAIADGKKRFRRLAVVGGNSKICRPCGVCLQFMSEFVKDAEIIMCNARGKVEIDQLKNLLPKPFHSLR